MGLVLINQPDPTPSRDLRVTGGAPEIVRLLVKLAKLDMNGITMVTAVALPRCQ